MSEQTKALEEFFAQQPDIVVALLFGSFGTERQRVDSDVDIAVSADRALTPARHTELIAALAQLTGRAVDVIDLRTAGLPIQRAAITTGRTLFARNESCRGDLLSRYLVDAADFLPYYERVLRERREKWIG